MQHFVKIMMAVAVSLFVAAVLTPHWVEVNTINTKSDQDAQEKFMWNTGPSKYHLGPYDFCPDGESCVSNNSRLKTTPVTSATKALKSCQGLAISSTVFLFLALGLAYLDLDFKHQKLIILCLLTIGVVLGIACIALFANKASEAYIRNNIPGQKVSKHYGYSFVLAIIGIALSGVIAGGLYWRSDEVDLSRQL